MPKQVIATHYGEPVGLGDRGNVIECEPCGFKHIYPLPTPADIKAYYEKQFYGKERWPQYIDKMEFERDYWLAIYGERVRQIENLLGYTDGVPSPPDYASILDVGSGPGLFLAAAHARGWSAYGIEPSEQAANHANNIRGYGTYTLQETFEEFCTDDTYNAIHMSFLLEHMVDPKATLDKCWGLLDDGGILVIEVPNDFSELQKITSEYTEEKGWWISVPDHLNYFSKQSLGDLAIRSGFGIAWTTGTWDMNLFALMGLNYIDAPDVGLHAHHLRMKMEQRLLEQAPELKQSLYRAMSQVGVTRELVLFARKTSGG